MALGSSIELPFMPKTANLYSPILSLGLACAMSELARRSLASARESLRR